MRYIGNKTKILPFIEDFISSNIKTSKKRMVFCDMFAGTATVANFFKKDYEIIANDTMYSSYVLADGILNFSGSFFTKLGFDPFKYFNKKNTSSYTSGYCYNNFAPKISGRMYFSDENAKLIDYIRDTIDIWFLNQKIDETEKHYLIACLLESVSKVSNVAGVYAAYLHVWDSRATKRMIFSPIICDEVKYHNAVYMEDSNELIKKIKGDILYLDPPYTPTQYISQYHVLETIAKNDNPVHHGKGAHRDNGKQISKWCKKGYVHEEFARIIKDAKFKYIILSYSDAGIMSKEYIESVLKRYAVTGSYNFKEISFVKYKNTRAINKEIRDNSQNRTHYEWLFFIEKKHSPLYASPLNYIGGKYDALDFILQNLPNNYEKFYDLFGGGSTVGINSSNTVIYNDLNWFVRDLLKTIANTDTIDIYNYITKIIKKFKLAKSNKSAYVAFRNYYNSKVPKQRYPLDLYILICYGFEHQIRFNSKYEFNNPCGNSEFNQELLAKLITYKLRVEELNIKFESGNYLQYENLINKNDLVYCDPPYLGSCGAYNDGKRGFNGWDEEQEKQLLSFLDRLNENGCRFVLSNMKERGKRNKTRIIDDWAKKNGYTIVEDSKATKRNRQDRIEILITNFRNKGR